MPKDQGEGRERASTIVEAKQAALLSPPALPDEELAPMPSASREPSIAAPIPAPARNSLTKFFNLEIGVETGKSMATWVKYFENAAADGIQGVAYHAAGAQATSACAQEKIPGWRR